MRRWVRAAVAASLGGLGSTAAPVDAQSDVERRLTWPRVDVVAHLEADGRLTVRETQHIRFTGDWNGGERTFRLQFGQQLAVGGVVRLDPVTGARWPLAEGPLDRVDEYREVEGALRWRSRLPSDPPFRDSLIVYELDLRYADILVPQPDGTFLLDHDFAFAERAEPIEAFTLALTLDPVWTADAPWPTHVGPVVLSPGDGYVVRLPLRYGGAGRPAAVFFGASADERAMIVAAMLAAIAWLGLRFARRERRSGRWTTEPVPEPVTRAWIAEHVLSLRPEVAGALWDERTSAPEVAATIARMVTEGKLASNVRRSKRRFGRRDVLELRLLVDRSRLDDYESALIQALFRPGEQRTDTEQVRKRYESTGFDPATYISAGVKALADGVAPGALRATPGAWREPVALLAVTLGFAVAAAEARLDELAFLVPAGAAAFVLLFICIGVAHGFKREVRRPLVWLLPLLGWLGVGTAAVAWVVVSAPLAFTPWAYATAAAAWVLLVRTALWQAAIDQPVSRIRVRKRLAAAREHFRRELGKPAPDLDDAWFPWMIAFGLGASVDGWFRAFGGTVATGVATTSALASTGRGGGGTSTGGWTGFGGGGGFAGGGSSGSFGAFATAVSGMAASVSAPSSSSSGGGGGGGGSSGGGGGGGW